MWGFDYTIKKYFKSLPFATENMRFMKTFEKSLYSWTVSSMQPMCLQREASVSFKYVVAVLAAQ